MLKPDEFGQVTRKDFINEVRRIAPVLAQMLDGPYGPQAWHLGVTREAYKNNNVPCAMLLVEIAKEFTAGKVSLAMAVLTIRNTMDARH